MSVLVTGGTGFVGRTLVRELDDAIVVTRRSGGESDIKLPANAHWLSWPEPIHSPLPLRHDCRLDAVVNLMGESIADGRWSINKKRLIKESRVDATRNLVVALSQLEHRPKVLVSASAMGFYGSRGDQELDEAASSGTDFLAGVCSEWECAAMAARELGMRVVLLRIGLVLGSGGFLSKVGPVFRRGLGGRLGDGRQWTSWIHVDDLVRLILQCCSDTSFSGPVNASTPFPVRNAELTRTLAECVGRSALLPVPRFALRAAFGEMADVMLASIRMRPDKAIANRFEFQFPQIHEALRAALASP